LTPYAESGHYETVEKFLIFPRHQMTWQTGDSAMKLCAKIPTHIMLIVFVTLSAPNLYGDDDRKGDRIVIVTPGTLARLCPQPGCGPNKHITRIPEGTSLVVEDLTDFKIGTFSVRWFAVSYGGNSGWISIFDTDKAPPKNQ
jgi:hypothetical protein